MIKVMKKAKKMVLVAVVLGFAASIAAAGGGEPLRLKAIMNDLAGEMETISRGIWLGDFNIIEAAAVKVADHEKPPMAERMKILGFLKGRAGGFKAADASVHDNAMAMAEAAKREDMAGVVEKFDAVMKGCVECHTGYRADIVDHFYGGGS